jgi:ribose 5-phosphate isomerase B
VRIAIAADHNGRTLKARLIDHLRSEGHEVADLGPDGGDVVDYPYVCANISATVVAGQADRGVVIGGSGQGEHIACNKIVGVRAGLAVSAFTTEISRAHNDSNVLVIGAKVIDSPLAEQLLDLWIRTPFKGGIHRTRLDQISALERGDPLPPPTTSIEPMTS